MVRFVLHSSPLHCLASGLHGFPPPIFTLADEANRSNTIPMQVLTEYRQLLNRQLSLTVLGGSHSGVGVTWAVAWAASGWLYTWPSLTISSQTGGLMNELSDCVRKRTESRRLNGVLRYSKRRCHSLGERWPLSGRPPSGFTARGRGGS